MILGEIVVYVVLDDFVNLCMKLYEKCNDLFKL